MTGFDDVVHEYPRYPARDWDGVYRVPTDPTFDKRDASFCEGVRQLGDSLRGTDGGEDEEEPRSWVREEEEQEGPIIDWLGDGGSSSPMCGTSVVAGAPPEDEIVWGELYLHLRRVRRARRRRMEQAWGIVREICLVRKRKGKRKRFLPILREHLEASYDMTARLMDLHIYHPSNRLVLEMIVLREVCCCLSMELQPELKVDLGRLIDTAGVQGDGLGNIVPRYPRLLPQILDGRAGLLLANGSGDTPSPWHRLLELAAVLLNEGYPWGVSIPRLTEEAAIARIGNLWKNLESACRTLHPEEWAYAGGALSTIPKLVGLNRDD